MKLQHLLSAFFIAAVLTVSFFSGPCAASFVCSNKIILENYGMNWEYEECITDGEAIFFRELIDSKTGNNDSFVNAWEVRNMELELRDRLEKSIEKKPDVKLDGSSDSVKVRDVEFWLSDEALGTTHKRASITNKARVNYSFEEEIGKVKEGTEKKEGEGFETSTETNSETDSETDSGAGAETGNATDHETSGVSGDEAIDETDDGTSDQNSDENDAETSVWLLGTPDSEVTIVLPPGYDAKKTEGLEDKNEEFENSRMVLKGSFGPEGEITIWLSENESYERAALQDVLIESELVENKTLPVEDAQPEEASSTVGFFENFLRRLCLSPKA